MSGIALCVKHLHVTKSSNAICDAKRSEKFHRPQSGDPLTQAELGKLLELDRTSTSVSHAEHGRHSLNLSHLFFLKEYFDVEFDYFLGGLEWQGSKAMSFIAMEFFQTSDNPTVLERFMSVIVSSLERRVEGNHWLHLAGDEFVLRIATKGNLRDGEFVMFYPGQKPALIGSFDKVR